MEPRKERLYGLDIARIVAMFLVVLFHMVGVFSGYSDSCLAGRILRSFSACCVDLFALISGYVGCRARFRPSRFVMLWLQIVFTGIIIVGASSAFGFCQVTIKDWGKALIPITGHEYWYMTEYFLLFLLMPFLNAGFTQLSRRSIIASVAIMLLLVVILPAFNPYVSDTYVFDNGFSAAWLIVCYVIGGGMREIDRGCGSALFWFVVTIALVILNVIWSGGYTHPAVLALAASMLMTCARINANGMRARKLITFFSSTSLGVYLWHAHPIVYEYSVGKLHYVGEWNWVKAVPFLVIIATLVYITCSIIDYLRIRCFAMVKLADKVTKIDGYLNVKRD